MFNTLTVKLSLHYSSIIFTSHIPNRHTIKLRWRSKWPSDYHKHWYVLSVVECQRMYSMSLCRRGWQSPSLHWLATHLIWEELRTIITPLSAQDMGSIHNKHMVWGVRVQAQVVCLCQPGQAFVRQGSCTKKAFSVWMVAFSGQRGLSLFWKFLSCGWDF